MKLAPFPQLTRELTAALIADHSAQGEVTVQPLKVSESATFLVDGLNGGRRVVRVYRHGRHSIAGIRSELQWIDALHRSHFPTPGIIRTRSGELFSSFVGSDGTRRSYAVFEFLRPDSLEVPLEQHFEAIGDAAGKLQQHAKGWDLPSGFDRLNYDYRETLDPRTDWGSWPSRPLPASAKTLLMTAQQTVLDRLPAFTPESVQLVHADLKPVNSIWHDGTLFTIDFDDCGFAWPLFDMAASLTFHEADASLSGYVDSYLKGYTKHRTASAEELNLLPTFIMQRRLMIFGWLGAHPDHELDHDLDEMLAGSLEVAEKYLGGRLL